MTRPHGCPRLPGLVLAAWCALAPALLAVRWDPLSLHQLASQAERVVHARVTAVESARDADGRIFTRVEAETREVWKGSCPGGRCGWVAGGGVLGDRAETSEAQALYSVGDELVAFLVRNPDGDWVTVGMAQGRFQVRIQAGPGAAERRWVHNPFWGDDGAVRPASGGARLPARRPLALEELRRAVLEVSP